MSNTWTNCEGLTRRDGLKLGLGGLIGGGLSGALSAQARASEGSGSRRKTAQADACILVWMDGGPSHYETFDPKPDAPVEIRGSYQPIATQTPGIQFAQPMQKMAAISDDLAIVRSIRHDQGNHGAGNHYMMTGARLASLLAVVRLSVSIPAWAVWSPKRSAHHMGSPLTFRCPGCRDRAGRTSWAASTHRLWFPTIPTVPAFACVMSRFPRD